MNEHRVTTKNEELKMALYIKTIRKVTKRKKSVDMYIGKIVIGDFTETIHIPINFWTIDEYKKQWAEGLARIETHDSSCLIASIQDPKIDPYLNWWALYKVGDTVYIHNNMFVDFTYEEHFGNTVITRENCYDFISPRETVTDDGEKISEWSIPLSDIKGI